MIGKGPGKESTERRSKMASNAKQHEILLSLNHHFQSEHGFELLTPDAKLFCIIGARGSLSVKEAMLFSGLSYRGFYLVLGRLAGRGSIMLEGDPHDGRVKRISLGENGKSMLAAIQESMPIAQVRQPTTRQLGAQ
jgi:DNA-binding MarR family transcriptional regulator